jgi:cytochrome b561
MHTTYTTTAKLLHWSIGLLIIGLLASGWIMADVLKPPFQYTVFGIHKAVGVLVLGLVVVRVLYRASTAYPAALPAAKWQLWAADVVHGLLYATMLIMPVSGWVMSNAGGYPVSFFGLFTLPTLVAENHAFAEVVAGNIHANGLLVVGALLALHVGGALKRHFVHKDATLTRMLLTCKTACSCGHKH